MKKALDAVGNRIEYKYKLYSYYFHFHFKNRCI